MMHNRGRHDGNSGSPARGMVMNLGWRYDLIVALANWVMFRGKLHDLFTRALDLAQLRPGESVLDVGCGTGILLLQARQRVGPAGRAVGIDPGVRQIEWARRKAARRGIAAEFDVGGIERLPYPDATFDAVLSTMMMHHLPDDLKSAGLAEIARVLVPGGRVVVVDFKRSDRKDADFGAGRLAIQDVPQLMSVAGFTAVQQGEIRLPRFPGVHGAGFVSGQREVA